jgi:hypothetical protein
MKSTMMETTRSDIIIMTSLSLSFIGKPGKGWKAKGRRISPFALGLFPQLLLPEIEEPGTGQHLQVAGVDVQ